MVGLTCSSSLFRTRNHALCTATHSHHRPHPSLHGESGGECPRCRLCPQVLTLVHAPLTAVVVDVVLAIIRSRDQPLHIHQINGTATQKQWTSPRNRTREERRSPSPLQEAAKLAWIGDAGIDVLSWPLRVGPRVKMKKMMDGGAMTATGVDPHACLTSRRAEVDGVMVVSASGEGIGASSRTSYSIYLGTGIHAVPRVELGWWRHHRRRAAVRF